MTSRATPARSIATLRRAWRRLVSVTLASCLALAVYAPAPVAAQVTGGGDDAAAEPTGPPSATEAPPPAPLEPPPVLAPEDPTAPTISPTEPVDLSVWGEFLDLFALPGYPGFPVPSRRPLSRIEVRPFLALSEIYTDNFRLSADDPEENFRTVLATGLGLALRFPLFETQLAIGMSATYDTLTDEFQLRDNLLGLAQAQQTWQLNPNWRLTATEVVTRSDDPGLSDGLGLRERREGFWKGRFGLTSDYRLGTFDTQQFYTLSVFLDDSGRDTIAHRAGASVSRTFFRRTTARVQYAYLTSTTSGGSDVAGHELRASLAQRLGYFATAGITGSHALRTATNRDGDETDFTLSTVAVFAATGIPQAWSLNGRVGVSRLESEPDPDREIVRFFGSATLSSYHLAPLTISLRGHAGFSETYAEGENFGVVYTRGGRLSLSYPLTLFVRASATAFYRENEFTGVASEESGTTEIYGGAILVSIRLRSWLSLGMSASHTERTSLRQTGRIVENRASIALRAGF